MGYSQWGHSPRSLKVEGGKRESEVSLTMEEESEKKTILLVWKMEKDAQQIRVAEKTGKVKETGSPLKTPERSAILMTP